MLGGTEVGVLESARKRADGNAPATQNGNCFHRAFLWLFTRHFRVPIMVLIVVAWVCIGGVFNQHYALEDKCAADGTCKSPTFAMGVFFGIQAGLCVGYGLLTEKSDQWSWFTVVHAGLGVTIIVTILSVWIIMIQRGNTRFRHKILLTVTYVIILMAGTVFEMAYNDWSFTQAFYFSFFGLSTGGLRAPGTTDDAEMWFLSIWMLLGIPAFAAVVGFVIEGFVSFIAEIEKEAAEQDSDVCPSSLVLESFAEPETGDGTELENKVDDPAC